MLQVTIVTYFKLYAVTVFIGFFVSKEQKQQQLLQQQLQQHHRLQKVGSKKIWAKWCRYCVVIHLWRKRLMVGKTIPFQKNFNIVFLWNNNCSRNLSSSLFRSIKAKVKNSISSKFIQLQQIIKLSLLRCQESFARADKEKWYKVSDEREISTNTKVIFV